MELLPGHIRIRSEVVKVFCGVLGGQQFPDLDDFDNCGSGKEKAHKHEQMFPVTARVGGGLPTFPAPKI